MPLLSLTDGQSICNSHDRWVAAVLHLEEASAVDAKVAEADFVHLSFAADAEKPLEAEAAAQVTFAMLVAVAKLDVAVDIVEEPERHLKARVPVGSEQLEVPGVGGTDAAVRNAIFALIPLEVDVSDDRKFLANDAVDQPEAGVEAVWFVRKMLLDLLVEDLQRWR